MLKFLMTVVIIVATPVAGLAQPSVNQLQKQAKQFTVLIQGPNSGSGVIVAQQGNNYWVLTAQHVVQDFYPQEPRYIVTADQQRHSFKVENIKTLSDVDLAKIPFRSNKDYPVAPLANSDPQQDEPVFVSGFARPSATINETQYIFRNGQLKGVSNYPLKNGYELFYSNPTLPGMSGGAVLNQQGELIGIHAGMETGVEPIRTSNAIVETEYSIGIPIEPHLEWITKQKETETLF